VAPIPGRGELEADPVGQVERLYAALGLPAFSVTRPAVERYVNSIRGYQKNEFPELPAALRQRIADAWRPCFEQWEYATDPHAGVAETPKRGHPAVSRPAAEVR
jgi:hypothetical protein